MKKRTKISLRTKIYLTIAGLVAMTAGSVYAAALFFGPLQMTTGIAVSPSDMYATAWCDQHFYGVDCMGNTFVLGLIPGGDNPCIEKYIDIAPKQAIPAGFTVKDVFITEGQNIYKFTYPAGPISFFAQVGCPFSTHSSITFDKVGTFGNNMIVTCENGPVWTIDGSGNVTFVGSFTDATHDTHPEGPAVAPLAFGPGLPVDLAGKVLVADEFLQVVDAMDNLGNVTYNAFTWPPSLGKGSENVSGVPQIPCTFGCQAQGPGKFFQNVENFDSIIFYAPGDFASIIGDVIVTTEAEPPDTTAGTLRVHFNPVTHLYDTSVFDATFNFSINEGARFVDCDVATPTPTPTSTATFTPTPTATFTPTPTPTSTPSGVCPLTQGYWKNHPNAWPVNSLMLGSQTYTKAELLNILNTPVGGDASLNLAHQLIAAKLNIAAGSDPTPVSSTSPIATSAERPILSNSTIQNGGMPGMNGIAAMTSANTMMGSRCVIAINPSLPRPRAPPATAIREPEGSR